MLFKVTHGNIVSKFTFLFTETLDLQGFPIFYARKYPNRTQTIPNHHMFSMKACILFDDSRRIVSVTCPYRSKVNAAE